MSVRRGETLMRAVGPDFVLAQGDVLYFTGMVENLGVVCAEHGLEAVTAEHDESSDDDDESSGDEAATRRTRTARATRGTTSTTRRYASTTRASASTTFR